MASVQSLKTVQQLYIAYYQRPADPSGLRYWADRLDANGGSLNEIDDAFGNSPETEALYGPINSSTIGEVIDKMYLAMFDRLPDAAGKQFYIDGFNAGTFTSVSLAYDILIGAQNSDAVAIANKTQVADLFTETIDGRPLSDPNFGQGTSFEATYAGDDDAAAARAMLASVTSSPTTVLSEQQVVLFVQGVIADPGDPILVSNVVKVLTPGVDNVDLSASLLADTVLGLQDANPALGTFTNGDRIVGGGNTLLSLTTNGGTTIASAVQNLAQINVTSVVNTTVKAVNFSNIGEVNLVGGINGNWTFFDGLDLGTKLGIVPGNITGSISASFDVPGVEAYGWIENNAVGKGGTVLLDAEGNIAINIDDSVSASAEYWDGPITIGAVTVQGGNEAWAGVSLDADGASDDDLVVGSVDAAMGDSSSFSFDAWASNDITIGNINVAMGATASVSITIAKSEYSDDLEGSITVGDISVAAGDDSDVEIYASMTVSETGDITGDLTLGNVSVAVGENSQVYVNASMSASSGSVEGDLTVGDITVSGGATNDVGVYVSSTASADVGNVTAGNITVGVGDSSSVDVFVGAHSSVSGDVGNVEAGDATVQVGDSSSISLDFYLYASSGDVGDLTVGDVVAAAGDDSYVGVRFGGSTFTAMADDGSAGDVDIGDITAVVGNGTSTDYVTADVDVEHSAQDGVGSLTIGDVTLVGGDYANLTFDVNQYVSSDGDTGALKVGDITVLGGESAVVSVSVSSEVYSDGNVGDFEIGDIGMTVAQDAYLYVDLYQYVGSAGDIGNMAVGDITVVAGDNLTADLYIYGTANSGDAGTMTVGDVNIAASATTTVDLSGFSSISLTIEHFAYSGALLGALTVGDVSLSVGDESVIFMDVYQTGSADLVDDLTIGNVTLQAGDSSTVDAEFYFSNSADNGDLGNFTMGVLDVVIGASSDFSGTVSISNSSDGDLGNVSIAGVSLNVGDSASASFTAEIYVNDGDAGVLSFGDQTVIAGENAEVSLSQSVDVYGDIAGVAYGNLNFSVGVDADVYWSPTIWASGDIGDVIVGDITAVLAEDAYLSVSLNVTATSGDIGDISIGNISVALGENADVGYLDFTFEAYKDIGVMTVGNIAIDAGVDSSLSMSFTLSASGDVGGMTVGDLSILAAAGSDVSGTFSISASDDAGFMTVGDITIAASDGEVTETVAGSYGAADVGKHNNGAQVDLEYNLYGTNDGDLTVGDITVALDTLSDVSIDISQTNSGDVIIGDLTVSGAVGSVAYTGGAVTPVTGDFDLNVVTSGTITIGNVDYSGYTKNATIDMSWTDLGAASILGSAKDDTITGNAASNKIQGGKGVDTMTGNGGNDTFVSLKGDGLTGGDNVTDWSGDDSTATAGDKLAFGSVAGSATNYEEGGDYGSYALFLDAAADALDSTVKYFAGTFGGNLYVAANLGSGEADVVIQLVGQSLTNITYADIAAGP